MSTMSTTMSIVPNLEVNLENMTPEQVMEEIKKTITPEQFWNPDKFAEILELFFHTLDSEGLARHGLPADFKIDHKVRAEIRQAAEHLIELFGIFKRYGLVPLPLEKPREPLSFYDSINKVYLLPAEDSMEDSPPIIAEKYWIVDRSNFS